MKLSNRCSPLAWAATTITTTAWWFLLGSSSGVVVAANEDCNAGEENLEFMFFLDEDSTDENGWSLTCEGGEGTIWHVPVGHMQTSNANGMGYIHQVSTTTPFIKEQACLPVDYTCHFTFEDLYGDGLLFPGYYYLTFGATTVAVSEEGEEFFEKAYCFGPNCPIPAKEVDDQCDNVLLIFQADNDHPEESSVEIECNGSTIFQQSDFTTTAGQEEGGGVEFEQCIGLDQCCTLTMTDSINKNSNGGDGTSHAFVEWANQVIFLHDDTSADNFGTVSLKFGLACPMPTEEVSQGDSKNMEAQEGDNIFSTTPEQKDGLENGEMLNETAGGMSSIIKIGLVLVSTLALLGLITLAIARYCYSTTTPSSDAGGVEEETGAGASNTIVFSPATTGKKDFLECQSVSSSSATEVEDDL